MSCQPVCNCGLSMSNTGTDCTPLIEVASKLILVPICDSTGVRNHIDLTTTLNEAYFQAFINNADKSKRWYPLPDMKNVGDNREEPLTEDFDDGIKIFIREGARTFEGQIVGKKGGHILKGKIEAARCQEMGVYIIHRLGGITGIVSEDKTKLYPYRLDSESISASLVRATNTTTQKLSVKFNFHPDESDGCIGMITPDQYGDAVPSVWKGLLDVHVKYTTPITTGVILTLYTDYGTPIDPTLVKGLVVGDFAAYNVTQSSAIALTGTGASFSESASGGVYTIAYKTSDDPSVSDVVRFTITKAGFDFTDVTNNPVTTA